MSNEFAYVVQTNRQFEEAAVSLLRAIEQAGWGLFAVYDLRERLAAKGFSQRPLKVFELCSAKDANAFLNQDRLVSIFMPCRIIVFEDKDGSVRIAAMKISIMSSFFPLISMGEMQTLEKRLCELIDTAK